MQHECGSIECAKRIDVASRCVVSAAQSPLPADQESHLPGDQHHPAADISTCQTHGIQLQHAAWSLRCAHAQLLTGAVWPRLASGDAAQHLMYLSDVNHVSQHFTPIKS
jgi:hypothetical protein